MEELGNRKRSRVDSFELATGSEFGSEFEFEFESPKAKKIREQLLSLLDDSDVVPDRDPVSQSHDLDSVIRSFEEEISGSGSSSPAPELSTLFDVGVGSGEVMPGGVGGDFSVGELDRVETELPGIGELWEFQDDLLSYDPFRFGSGGDTESVVTGEVNNPGNGKEYVSVEGIFDYSDENFGSDLSWRYESLPAL